MARSSTTGVYTRVDNSFSNPIFGTVISPTDADSFFDDIDGAMNSYVATSTTSLAIGTGSKTFTVASDVATKVFLANTQIHAFSLSNSANFMDCTVTSYNTGTGALVTNCFAIGGSGTITDWVIVTAGARGGAGPIAGFRQTYDSTTSDADPGSGNFRLNNATPASATAAYFDNADTNGTSLTTILDALDDHGNSSARGILRAEKENDPTVWGQWLLSSSIVDGTGYRKATLSGGSGSGAFTAADAFRWAFYPKGADGTIGGTTGTDDNRLLRADGTGGGTAQSSTVSIDDSGNITGAGTIDIGNADTTLSRAAAGELAVEGTRVQKVGKQTIGVASGGIFPATTNGCAALAQAETTTNKINYKYLAFDASAVEYAWVWFPTPKSYNASTFTMRFVWTHPSTVTNFGVVWQAEILSLADDDAIDTAVGTAVTVTDTGGTTQDFYTSSETGAITASNTASKQDWMAARVSRLATNGSDTLAVDAHLIGVEIYYTTDGSTDA